MTRRTALIALNGVILTCILAASGLLWTEVHAEGVGGQAESAGTDGRADRPTGIRRVFSIEPPPIRVPDGTLVYPFLNPMDSTSGLPSDMLDGFSLAAGVIEPHQRSKIHVMPLVTQVTFVLSGVLEVRMKEAGMNESYTHHLEPNQAVITRPGTFFQLINSSAEPTRVLYIVSPPYLFVMGAGGAPIYDDSVVLTEDWEDLKRQGWQSPALLGHRINERTRQQAYERLKQRNPSR